MAEDFQPEDFDYNFWHQTAWRLRNSSFVILKQVGKESHRTDDQFYILKGQQDFSSLIEAQMMLAGFALENLIKAVSIKKYLDQGQEISSFQELKRAWGTGNGHDILSIADQCNFEFTGEERNYIERCVVFDTWAGRYHLPKFKYQQVEAEEQGLKSLRSTDEFVMDSIFKKAEEVLGPVKY